MAQVSTPTELPEGFPQDLVHDLELADGRKVHLRPILPDDEADLRQAVAEADPETLRMRFLGGRPPQSDEDFAHLVRVDYVNRLAVVALTPEGVGVGIARYERLHDDGGYGDAAEIAVAVDRDWRHLGVATALVQLLGEAALRQGVRRFQAEFFADNIDVTDLIAGAGLHYVRSLDETGVVSVDVALPDEEPPEPAAPDAP